ncbi:nadD [Symbiodinium sp. KB8]|nr:nadD [Symbiodinium sp. KB8]
MTAAHLSVAADVAADESVDEVWIVPCGARPDKASLTTAASERLLQCVLAVEAAFPSDLPVYVMPLEVAESEAVPSYVLMTTLAQVYPTFRFSLVIGMDLLAGLQGWQFAEGLMQQVSFLVVPRPGYTEPTTPEASAGPQHARLALADALPTVEVQLSSSEVRQRIKHSIAGDAVGASLASGGAPALCAVVPTHVAARLLQEEEQPTAISGKAPLTSIARQASTMSLPSHGASWNAALPTAHEDP